MAGRFGRTGQSSTAVNVTSPLSSNPFLAGSVGISGASSTTPTSNPSGSNGYGAAPDELTRTLAANYDMPTQYIQDVLNPGFLSQGNKYAAAGIHFAVPEGEDPAKYARNPIFLRKAGDRLPSDFEMNNPWAYDPKREPIVGEGGKTLDANSSNIDDAIKFTQDGYIPPSGSPAYKALADFYSSTGETLEQTLQRLDVTGRLGQQATPYPTGLAKLTNSNAIPMSAAVTYNPPAYDTVDLGDGYTKQVPRATGWDGRPAGWTVSAQDATSANNFPALSGNMTPDDPNFKPTPNPVAWILPSGATVKSVPGSGSTVGFNMETWKFQVRPWEVGKNTTWELAATNPNTGKLDPSTITKEVAILLKQYGNLPAEYDHLTTDAPSYYAPVPKTAPINPGIKTTPINVPGSTAPATGMPKVQDVSKTLQTGGGFSGTGAMYANRPEPVGSVAPPTTGPVASKTPLDIGERGTAPMAAPAVASVNVQTGGTNDGTSAMYAQKPSTTPGTVADTKYQANVAELNSRVVSFNAPIPRPSATVRSLA